MLACSTSMLLLASGGLGWMLACLQCCLHTSRAVAGMRGFIRMTRRGLAVTQTNSFSILSRLVYIYIYVAGSGATKDKALPCAADCTDESADASCEMAWHHIEHRAGSRVPSRFNFIQATAVHISNNTASSLAVASTLTTDYRLLTTAVVL